jgi:drug/metabolite transporter (DMT)-like permease
MILYNTLMGVSAGLALILVSLLGRKLIRREAVAPEGWSLVFGVLGFILALLGGLMATTWPLTANPPINIIFAEPTLVLGLLLLAASFFLWQRRTVIVALTSSVRKEVVDAQTILIRVLTPVSWLTFGLGMILMACSVAVFRYGFVGGAPAQEPITGRFGNLPWIENSFFGLLYLLPAIALLLAPWALRRMDVRWARVIGVLLTIAGVAFLLFSTLNYYTHIGLMLNFQNGNKFLW